MKNVFGYTRQAVKNGQERIPSRLALLFAARIKTQVMDGPKAVAVVAFLLWFVDVKFQLSFNVSWSLIHHERERERERLTESPYVCMSSSSDP